MTLPTIEEIAALTTPELVEKIHKRVDECGITLSEEPETIEIRDGDTFLNQVVKGLIIDAGKKGITETDLYRRGFDIKCYRDMKTDLDAALNMTISKFNTWANFFGIKRGIIYVRYDVYTCELIKWHGGWNISIYKDGADPRNRPAGILQISYKSEDIPELKDDPLGYFARVLFKQFPYDISMTDTKNIKRYAINNFISALRNDKTQMTSYIFEKLMEIHNMAFAVKLVANLSTESSKKDFIISSEWSSRPNLTVRG